MPGRHRAGDESSTRRGRLGSERREVSWGMSRDRTRGCMGASGFGVAPVDGIVMNVLVVEIQPTFVMSSYPQIVPMMFVYSILVEKPQDGV